MKNLISKLKQIDKGTLCRTILQGIAYINQFVAIIGQTSFASAIWYQWLSFALTLIATAISYWYNNDWTKGALLIREVCDMFKDKKIEENELKEFVEKHSK